MQPTSFSTKIAQAYHTSLNTVTTLPTVVYEKYFNLMKGAIEGLSRKGYRALAVTVGMVLTEPVSCAHAVWNSIFFRKDPSDKKEIHKPHVLLMHGALGDCYYMKEGIQYLKSRGFTVDIINTGFGEVNDDMRKQVNNKIMEIRTRHNCTIGDAPSAHKEFPKVHIIAHSMGGYLALASAFQNPNMQGDKVTLSSDLRASPYVGKIITLAMPFDAEERQLFATAYKLNDVYNINAKYDALMGHKKPALDPQHNSEVNAGHIGIVYNKEAFVRAADIILGKS